MEVKIANEKPKKPWGRKPKLGQRRKGGGIRSRKSKMAKIKKEEEQKTKLKGKSDENLTDNKDKQAKPEKKSSSKGKLPNPDQLQDEEPFETQLFLANKTSPLSKRLLSKDDGVRLDGFFDAEKWDDKDFTREKFMTSLHLYVKESDEETLIQILSIMKSIFYSPAASQLATHLESRRFIHCYCSFLMASAQSEIANDLSTEIIPLIFNALPLENFLKDTHLILKSAPNVAKANMLRFLCGVVRAGHIVKLKYLKSIYKELKMALEGKLFKKKPKSKKIGTMASIEEKNENLENPELEEAERLKKEKEKRELKEKEEEEEKKFKLEIEDLKSATRELIEEMYLWMGDTMFQFLEISDKSFKEKLLKSDFVRLKILNFHGHKVKRVDSFDLEEPKQIDSKYFDSKWGDELMKKESAQRLPTLQGLNKTLRNCKRLDPEKSKPDNLVSLAQRILLEGNTELQIEVILTVRLLAASLRTAFESSAKRLLTALVVRLKDKNSKMTETILKCVFEFYRFLSVRETLDAYKEHLFDRSLEKKKNLLSLLIRLAENDVGFVAGDSEDSAVRAVVKMCLKLFEEGESLVVSKACELIAKLKRRFDDSVNLLISDLPSARLAAIEKFIHPDAKSEFCPSERSAGGDHLANIKELREELFSGKTVKPSDVEAFGGFLQRKLEDLENLTDGFTDVDDEQLHEIYLLVEDLVLKIDPGSVTEESRRLLVRFYFETSNFRSSAELIRSMQFFVDSALITPREFLLDTFDFVREYFPAINDDFVVNLIRLLETELVVNRNLLLIAHDEFIEFLEARYSVQESSARQRLHIVQFMRTVETKFGVNHLEHYPELLLHEYSLQKTKATRAQKRFLNKLKDRNGEARAAVIHKLLNTEDPQVVLKNFSQNDFLNFLKRLLIQEMEAEVYALLVRILEKYLLLYKKDVQNFSLKSYLYVFQIIINNYANKGGDQGIYLHIDKLFHKTVKCLSPNVVFSELLEGPDNLSMREDILNFYLIYHTDIRPGPKFMSWLSGLIDDKKMYTKDLRKLVEDVLLMLKATEDDELLRMGAENPHIRNVWHRNEENILFDRRILWGDALFDSVSRFRQIKKFIITTLGIDQAAFYSKTIGRLFKGSSEFRKVKAVFYLIKSSENTNRIAEYIFSDIRSVDWKRADQMTRLVVVKLVFNLLKNKVHEGDSEFFQNLRNFLIYLIRILNPMQEPLREIFGFTDFEFEYFHTLVNTKDPIGFVPVNNDREDEDQVPQYGESAQPQDNIYMSRIAQQQNPGYNGVSHNNFNPGSVTPHNISNNNINPNINGSFIGGLQSDYQSTHHSIRKKPSQRSLILQEGGPSTSTYNGRYNDYDYQSTNDQSARSIYSTNRRLDEPVANLERLMENLKLMTTFDFDQFNKGTRYIKLLLSSIRDDNAGREVHSFLITNSDQIIRTYVQVISGVMPAGINFRLEVSHYATIFKPFNSLINVPNIFTRVEQATVNSLIFCVIQKLVLANQEKEDLAGNNDQSPELNTAHNVTKWLNSITLKIIQKCEVKLLIQGLSGVLIDTRASEDWGVKSLVKANSLAAKCIIRSIKKVEGNLLKLEPKIAFYCMFVYIHEYGFQQTQEDAHAWKAFRTLVNEMARAFPRDRIWTAYRSVFSNVPDGLVAGWLSSCFGPSDPGMSSHYTSSQNLHAVNNSRSRKNLHSQSVLSQTQYGNLNHNASQAQLNINTPELAEVHGQIMELIQVVNRETRVSHVNRWLKQIFRLVDANREINFEQYAQFFIKQRYFDKIYRSLFPQDNMSDMKSVLSTNTRPPESTYNYNPKARSIRSTNKSPARSRKHY